MVRALRTLATFGLLLIMAIPGMWASWRYAKASAPPVSASMSSSVSKFEQFKGVYIKSVEFVTQRNATNVENGFNLPATHEISVDPSNSGGYVTYKITFHNNTDVTYWYIGTQYSSDYENNALFGTNGGITVRFADQASDSTSTFDTADWIPPQTERSIYVTYTYGATANAQGVCLTSLGFIFNVKMDAVKDEFLAILNDTSPGGSYEALPAVFNNSYSTTGSLSISTETHPEFFESMFDDFMVNIDGEEKQASVVIRRENLDNDSSSGDKYSGSGPSGCEYTLYITVESLTPGTSPTVYAIAYSRGANGMGDAWYQVGELYEGTAPIKADGTVDYANWRATEKTYKIANGIEYKVGAPNGDQYDIMNTMEQLVSAVDQDIFNQIDNTNIFKKVYDIIKKHQGSTDPAVIGLRNAFADASIFYRNLNNGQEFKVVRDKYTRAEIIYALQNIQMALDYYYETFPD